MPKKQDWLGRFRGSLANERPNRVWIVALTIITTAVAVIQCRGAPEPPPTINEITKSSKIEQKSAGANSVNAIASDVHVEHHDSAAADDAAGSKAKAK